MTTRQLIVRPVAEEELADAMEWYERQRVGLGDQLLEAVKSTMAAIRENPGAFAAVHREIRRALVSRFPYGVFFVVEEERLVVVAIMHLKRDPKRWQQRS